MRSQLLARSGLHALYAANKGKGTPLAVSITGREATIEIYDFIVTSDADVDWYGGGIAAERFARELRALTDVDTVHLRINSPGGDVFGGVAMAQAIRETSATVIAHVDGYAASIASLLTVAADQSVISPGGMVMIHKAWTIGFGNADDMAACASLLGKIDADLVDAYVAKAGSDTDWLAAMAAETWYRADEAVALGLVDSVAPPAEKKAAAAARAFDLSAYAHPPEALKPAPVAEPVALSDDEITDDIARRQRLHAVRLRYRAD